MLSLCLTAVKSQDLTMSFDPTQVYSATYSNVPVFEFVTSEGPIMRRKSDSWINATHILKIAKFPKARRTRILEKDVQTGVHEKVQGGYGKYQGTYVPLERGREIAASFGVYEVLKPIFDFQFIEGKSLTPPPAPKHNHASALNVSRKLQQQKVKIDAVAEPATLAKRTRSSNDTVSPKRVTRTKRVTLSGRGKPDTNRSRTAPIDSEGPNVGTFSSRREHKLESSFKLPPFQRQETERDLTSCTASSMNVRREDLEPDNYDENDRDSSNVTSILNAHVHANSGGGPGRLDPHVDHRFALSVRDSYDDEIMSGRELFESREFANSKEFFERYGAPPSRGLDSTPAELRLLGDIARYLPFQRHSNPHLNSSSLRGDPEAIDYFNVLLNYLLDESPGGSDRNRNSNAALPEKVLNPPQPFTRVIVDQPIDSDGNTIFHWSCAMANIPMMEFLLSVFPDSISTELKNIRGETPLLFLVQFNNSYILNNFPVMFDLLFDSVLSTDNFGRTVLHHIALACEPSASSTEMGVHDAAIVKESFAAYYFEVILAKIVKFPEFNVHSDSQSKEVENKKDIMVKFINHQDNEGNTALHIVAFSLARKCIRTFIKYHVYLDFSIRNLLNCTIEGYLASHNYVLRLEGENDELLPLVDGTLNRNTIGDPTYRASSFESQTLSTRLAVSMHASVAHRVTEKLSLLKFQVERELKHYDEKIFSLLEYYKLVGLDKIASQKAILQLFNLDYLLEDAEKEFETSLMSSQGVKYGNGEQSNDMMIQEEIKRLANDLCFQYLTLEYDFDKAFLKYLEEKQKIVQEQLVAQLEKKKSALNRNNDDGVKEENDVGGDGGNEKDVDQLDDDAKLDLAVQVQKQILKRKHLACKIYLEEVKTPYAAQFPDEFKENKVDSGNKNAKNGSETRSMIANFPMDDKLYKYCKLISLSCGMSLAEVENSVDLIEQSLARSINNTS